MSWLEGNPLGAALAAACGLLLLLALLLGWAWSWPVSSGAGDADAAGQETLELPQLDSDLGPLSEYQVVNDRPVFNVSRRPQVDVEGEEEGPVINDQGPVEAPDVRLTGVVITPEQKIVMLTPGREGEPVIVHEGMPLEGDYVGWTVSSIDARNVTLESSAGESLRIDLMVHDTMIAEPPKPKPPTPPDEGSGKDKKGEPLTRAEEIRQRIQERREQLRREAEQEEEAQEAQKASQRNEYQEAIRAMMNRNRNNDNEPTEDED